jgi:hypothetical protein
MIYKKKREEEVRKKGEGPPGSRGGGAPSCNKIGNRGRGDGGPTIKLHNTWESWLALAPDQLQGTGEESVLIFEPVSG